jgi:tRNA A37 threonylcarbamoyladenosine dehydratase
MGGENICYIYTNSKHMNPLCRVAPILKHEKEDTVTLYDKEKYCDVLLDAAETVLGTLDLMPTFTENLKTK